MSRFIFKFLVCVLIGFSSLVAGFAVKAEDDAVYDDGFVASGMDLESIAEEPWRKDVKFVLSDNDSAGSKCEKKIKILGLPETIVVDWVRIWTTNCSMCGTSVSPDFVYNNSEGSYEGVFTPELDAKSKGCKNLISSRCMSGFRVSVFLKNKVTGESVKPIKIELSNQGLKRPAHLGDFKNFKLNFVKDLATGSSGKILIYGVPENVSEVKVSVEEYSKEVKDGHKCGTRINQCENVAVARGEDGVFALDYCPKEADSDRYVMILFEDSDGYGYRINESF